jgi:2-amino-4-hydroxy-6-hydroxymethyldihydropteridine diphosphokinase
VDTDNGAEAERPRTGASWEDAASRAALSLGSNQGPREELLERAATALLEHPRITLVAASPPRVTAPQGVTDQPDFLNQVVLIRTDLSPWELLETCLGVESDLGRVRGPVRWGPRTIDIDILAYDRLVVRDPRLTLPHPALPLRPFFNEMLREVGAEDLLT